MKGEDEDDGTGDDGKKTEDLAISVHDFHGSVYIPTHTHTLLLPLTLYTIEHVSRRPSGCQYVKETVHHTWGGWNMM